jgi:hypothetical protein
MTAEAIAELLAILARLPAHQAEQVRTILREAGVDFDTLRPRAAAPLAGLLLVLALAVVVGFALAWLIVELLNRR